MSMQRTLDGRVWIDRNGDGRRTSDEPAVPDVPVCLDGHRVVKTDPAGQFLFDDMAIGIHSLSLNCGIPLIGLIPLTPVDMPVELTPDDPPAKQVNFRLDRRSTNDPD